MLVEYFVQRYTGRADENIRSIDKKTRDLLLSYDWPGNIRELQNIIERSVILGSGDVFSVDEFWLSKESSRPASGAQASQPSKGEPRSEREMIEAVIGGADGEQRSGLRIVRGCARLKIAPSTLAHRIKALNINKSQFKFG